MVWVPPNCTERLQPLDLIFNRSFKNALRNVMEASLWQAIYGSKLDLDVEDHIRRRQLKAFMSRPSLMRRLIEEFLPAALQHVRSRQASNGMPSRSWDKAGLTQAITDPASVSQETIAGTETWPTKFYMIKGLQEDPIVTSGRRICEGFVERQDWRAVRTKVSRSPEHQSLITCSRRASQYNKMGKACEFYPFLQARRPLLQVQLLAAQTSSATTHSGKWNPSAQRSSTAKMKNWKSEDWSWLEDGSEDETAVAVAANCRKRKTAHRC